MIAQPTDIGEFAANHVLKATRQPPITSRMSQIERAYMRKN